MKRRSSSLSPIENKYAENLRSLHGRGVVLGADLSDSDEDPISVRIGTNDWGTCIVYVRGISFGYYFPFAFEEDAIEFGEFVSSGRCRVELLHALSAGANNRLNP